jgi:RHS repeat-associated protein
VLIPSILNRQYEVEVRELATGFLVSSGVYDPPATGDDLVLLPPDNFGDTQPPLPIAGGPVRFFRFFPNERLSGDLDEGIRWSYDATLGELRVEGDPASAHPQVEVVLLDFDGGQTQTGATGADGSFSLQAAAPLGHRWVLAVGAVVTPDEVPEITFSEGLDLTFAGLQILSQAGTEVRLFPQPVGNTDTVRLVPLTHWHAGRSYTIRLGPEVADAAGDFESHFEGTLPGVAGGEVLDTYDLTAVRDVARLGSWLFVAADFDGLMVIDAADPSDLQNVVPSGVGFPFTGADPVTGVDVDPHGLVYVVGGGVTNFGQLKIFDPLLLDPQAVATAAAQQPPDLDGWFAAFRGSTLISDKIGGTGTQLPQGTPKRVSVLSNNQVDRWNVGQVPPDAALALNPPPELWSLTVGGRAPQGQEVELENLDSGDRQTVLADAAGELQFTLSVHTGDQLRLTRPGDLVTVWRAGQRLSGDLWVSPWNEPQGYTLQVSGEAEPRHPVTLKDLTRGRWYRVDADAQGHFEVTLEVFPGDELELLRNVDTFAYVATSGVGIQVVDAGRLYSSSDSIQSHVIGIYSGAGDPALNLCGFPVSDISTALLDVGSLLDTDNDFPFTVAGLVAFKGFALINSDVNNPGELSFINHGCAEVDGDGAVSGFEVVQDYPFDFDGDGAFSAQEVGDYVIVAHHTAGVLVYAITDRTGVVPLGQVKVPGNAAAVHLDRVGRRLYVSGYTDGVYVIDFDLPPFFDVLDDDGDGVDDRVIETILLGGNTNAGLLLVPELGLGFAGGLGRGLTSMAVGEPKLVAVRNSVDGPRRAISRLAPFGVPAAPENRFDPESFEQTGSFHVLAQLPGFTGDQVTVEVLGLGPSGQEIAAAGDPTRVPNLPPTSLRGTDAVVLERLAVNPWEEGYHLFESKEIVALADLRAAQHFERSDRDEEQCPRCDQPDYMRGQALEVLSGDSAAVRFTPESLTLLEPIYGVQRLEEAELELASVRWDVAPSTRQEPTLNPSQGSGEVAPGTLLHSGETSASAVDLFVRGRGLDFTFQRSYRSQTIGSGPLGPGWDHAYRQRLRKRPDGDVEWYDGGGRREVFKRAADGSLEPPAGRFVDLVETTTGWIMVDARRNTVRFDVYGRLASIADPFKTSESAGNEIVFHYDQASRLESVVDSLDRVMTFEYDAQGRLIKVADFDDREVEYAYDADGRLVEVRSPRVTGAMAPSFTGDRLITSYGYEADLTGDLAQKLAHRDNLTTLSDPRGTTWLELTYDDEDGDGRRDELSSQEWGGFSINLTYYFDQRRTQVLDRRANQWTYEHDEEGHMVRAVDPLGGESSAVYGEGGIIEELTRPLGSKSVFEYLEGPDVPPRSRGLVVAHRLIPDTRGTNSTAPGACTPVEEDECVQGIRCVCAYEVVSDTAYDLRTNLPLTLSDRRGNETSFERDETGLASSVSLPIGAEVQFEYNEYGQPTREESPIGTVKTYTYYEDGPSRGYLKDETIGGLTTSYEYDARGNVTAVVDRRGVRTETVWNELDWMVQVTQAASGSNDGAPALGYANRFFYDAVGNVVEEQSPYGETGSQTTSTHTTYGVLSEVLTVAKETEPGGPVLTASNVYDSNFNVVQSIDGNGHVDTFTYDERNLRTQASFGDGLASEQYGYDLEHNMTSRVDGRGNVRIYRYDGKSRLKETEDPLGNRTVTRYDDSDNATVIESWDAEGVLLSRVVNVYDEVSRLVEVRTSLFDDLGGETLVISRSEYDAASNLTKTIDPEGRETLFEYDDAERLARVIDPAGNVTQHQLDGNSNATLTTVVEKLPDGTTEPVSKTFAYDALNRLLNATDALGNVSRTEYDARSNVIRQIDQEGNVTSATYDALGRRLTATQPEGIALNYAYDGNSNLVTQADALGNATLYTYDALDRSTAVRYADLTQWTTVYDGNGNATRVTDANGTVIDQTFDAANRLTSRAATPAPGVEGSTVETFLYDGLSRQVRSQSGDVVVTSEYDSLSRLTAETVAGRRMEYFYNLAGAATGATYPSGLQVAIDLDVLDRPLAIHGDAQEAVGYEYRGPSLLHGKTLGNGLASTLSYDAARRLTEHLSVNQSGDAVLTETLAWSPRWLKVSHVRGDVAGADRVIHHDGAGRVTEVGTADLGVANNTTPSSAAVAAAADGFSYQYDAAQNLLTRTRRTAGTEEQVDLPSDGSGRNRPASVDGVLLEWDANGNLISKGDLGLHYDFRNRLVRVEREGVGDLAHYEYDAQNRRVKRTAGGVDTEIAWAGWQEMEEYVGGQLAKRRVFGTGLDEIVRLELDADGNGTLETELTPLYDSNGSLVAVTDTAGKPVERYDYSPYGEQLILVDSTAPQVTQVRIAGGELWVEVSEDVLPSALADAVTAGQVTLVDDATLEALPISLSQPVLTGRMARRRLVITTTDPPAAGTAVTLRFEPAALRDPFLNALAAAFELPFTWSTTDTVVHDGGAPSWQLVTVEDDHMLITFSEEVDPASVASAVTVDGGPLTWTPEPDRYALRSSTALAAGTHSLEILTTVADLDGQTLASGLTAAFEIAAAGSSFLVDQVADPRHVVSTATGNLHGFHGRPLDPETGLLYFRNRYYDPELGRFLSVDPMGFVDGPSPYAFAGYSPFDNSDPMGLCIDGFGDKTEFCQGLRRGLSEAVDRFIREEGDYTTRQSMQFLKGAVVGLQRLPKNVVEGGISLFKIAMGAAKAAGEAVVNPEEGIEKISEAVSSFSFDEVKSQTLSSLDQYLNNLANASPEKQGEIFGEDVISEVVAGGAATAAAKLTKATKVRRLAGAPRFGPRRSGQRIGESLESIMPGHRPGRIGGIVVDKYTSGAGDYVPGEDFIRLSRRGVKANTRLEVQQMSPDATWRDTLYFTVYHESFHKGIYPVDRFINRIIGKDPYWEFTRYRLAQEYTASVYGQLRASIRAAKGWRQTIKDIDTRRRYWRDFERASYLADR